MISYAYLRVSTKDQNLERQEKAVKEFRPDIPEHNIFRDKQTGKEFERVEYMAMKVILDHVVKANGDKEIIEVIFEEITFSGLIKTEYVSIIPFLSNFTAPISMIFSYFELNPVVSVSKAVKTSPPKYEWRSCSIIFTS